MHPPFSKAGSRSPLVYHVIRCRCCCRRAAPQKQYFRFNLINRFPMAQLPRWPCVRSKILCPGRCIICGPEQFDLFRWAAALAVCIGHRWNALPPTQLYEFAQDSGTHLPILIPPWSRTTQSTTLSADPSDAPLQPIYAQLCICAMLDRVVPAFNIKLLLSQKISRKAGLRPPGADRRRRYRLRDGFPVGKAQNTGQPS